MQVEGILALVIVIVIVGVSHLSVIGLGRMFPFRLMIIIIINLHSGVRPAAILLLTSTLVWFRHVSYLKYPRHVGIKAGSHAFVIGLKCERCRTGKYVLRHVFCCFLFGRESFSG